MVIREAERIAETVAPKNPARPPFQKLGMVPIELLGGTGRLLGVITLPPQAEIPDHPHNGEFEVYCMLTGTGSYNDNGSKVTISAGDVVYCPDGELHGLVNDSEAPLSFVAFIGTPKAK